MKKIVIRTLGGKGIGYGHYYRCLSLAKAIKIIDKSIQITFIINKDLKDLMKSTDFKFIISNDIQVDLNIIEENDVDLFIFDSYLSDDIYLKNIKKKTKLMLIDDNNDIYDSSIPDIVYNGNIHAEKLGYSDTQGQIRLLGSKYLIMKEEYWNGNPDVMLKKSGILVTTGGTDDNEIMLKVLEEIKSMDMTIKAVIGPGYSDEYIEKIENIKTENIQLIYKPNSLKHYIREAKFVITAGGSTVYEVLSQRSTPIIFSMADNQDLICKELNEKGIEYLGKYPDIDYSKLTSIINILGNGIEDISCIIDTNGVLLTANISLKELNL